MPLDLVPDFLPAGLVDDAAVLAFVIYLVRDELDAFLEWESNQGGNGGVATKR